jgi:hypothetical protein
MLEDAVESCVPMIQMQCLIANSKKSINAIMQQHVATLDQPEHVDGGLMEHFRNALLMHEATRTVLLLLLLPFLLFHLHNQ